MSVDYRRILVRHVTTERTTMMREQNNEYVFQVNRKANKAMIKEAVERAFGVKVASVRTSVIPGKLKRLRTVQPGRTPTWKKAIVRLKPNQVITAFENV